MVFAECDFSGVDLAESEHVGSAFRNCTFERTSLLHSTFRHCSLLGSVFTECRMRPLTLVEVDFTLAVLGGCDLRGVDLSDCRLREASLVAPICARRCCGARTCGGRSRSRLDEADLRGATSRSDVVDHRQLRGARIDIEQALAYAAAHGLDVHGEWPSTMGRGFKR